MGTVGMLETKSFHILRERLDEAVEEGINAVVYGPPSTEKTFIWGKLCAQFRAAGKEVIFVTCGPRTTESYLYRGIAEAAGIPVRSSLRWACRYAVLSDLRSRAELPAIILDEAQFLDLDALEGARQIHDLTCRETRPGCGVILSGSHSLLQTFLHPQRRLRMEQLLSRFAFRVQLQGMSEKEILSLGARAFGNGKPAKLSEKHQKALLDGCKVEDPFFIGPDGKPALRTYYSARRLLELIRQTKKALKPVPVESAS
jgi:type II secretory pathway predicted ATPase ExeA